MPKTATASIASVPPPNSRIQRLHTRHNRSTISIVQLLQYEVNPPSVMPTQSATYLLVLTKMMMPTVQWIPINKIYPSTQWPTRNAAFTVQIETYIYCQNITIM